MKINYAYVISFMRFCFLSIIALILLTVTCYPSISKGQLLNNQINITFSAGETLQAAVTKIEKKGGVHFAYDAVALRLTEFKTKGSSYSEVTIAKVLTGLLTPHNIGYEEDGGIIYLRKMRRRLPGRITGRVTDAKTGETLIGVSIRVAGQSGGTLSDREGRFSLECQPGIHTVVFTYIGYRQAAIENVTVKEGEATPVNLSLEPGLNDLNEVSIKADRVITSTNEKLISEMRNAAGVVSGISSEQITISVDRSASEVVRRVAGITLTDGFISIRGMTPRYNPVFLNNAFLPSTDPNKRAFNFDLLPSSVIDRIVVYKSASPELPADFAGGVVKVYTKRSVPIRRFEFSINSMYRTGNKFFDDHTRSAGGRYDWLGVDDGTRAMPANLPRNPYGQIILPGLQNTPNNYTQSNEVITNALLARSTKSWNLQQTYHPVDLQADATYYTYANIGSMKLNSVSVGRYENQRNYFRSDVARNANQYSEDEFPTDGSPLTQRTDYNYRLSYDSVYSSHLRLAAMQHFSLAINPDHEITAMGLFNRNTKDVLQINTLKEWITESATSLFPRRFENAYNTQELYLSMLGGTHKISDGRHLIEWSGSYSMATAEDPNQFSNVFNTDDASIIGDRQGEGKLNITDQTTWQLNTGTRRNTVVGRFADGEGKENRWQGNLDYTLKPVKKWEEFKVRAGGYFERRRKNYFSTTLAYQDYPEMPYGKDPWTSLGTDINNVLTETGRQMHTGIQDVGVGLTETNGYQASFDNVAGYLAMNIPLSFTSPFNGGKKMKLDIYGGARLEYSRRKVLTTTGEEILFEYGFDDKNQRVVIGNAAPPEQYFWLPSIAATLHLSTEWQLRASYGKTLNRPDLRELSPYLTYNPAEGATYIGRPTLQDARINNYDLRLEWYPSEGEAVTAGVYHKNMDNPIEQTMALTNTGIPGYTHSNLPFSRIYGAELEVRKKLDFFGDNLFQHMGIILNTSFNLTEASNEMKYEGVSKLNYYPGGTLRPFMGAAPWIINAGLFYDNKPSGSRFSLQYNVFGDRMLFNTSGVKVANLEPWTFERSRNLLDLSLLQKINKRISVRVAAQNLLNSAIKQYVDADFNKKFNTGPTRFDWNLDLNNGSLTTTYIQGDYYIRNYKPGVYYSVGFQFNL